MPPTSDHDVERVHRDGNWWTARVRYEHHFDTKVVDERDASHIAQGATAVVRDGRVELVRVPDDQFRDEADVRNIARKVSRDIEEGSA